MFSLQRLCVLTSAILVSSPKIISSGKNTVFFIPAVFLVTVTISWQYVCILGQNQITCWKLLSSLQFLQHYSRASSIKTIIWKSTIDAILSFIQTCHQITCGSYLIMFYQSIFACPFEKQLILSWWLIFKFRPCKYFTYSFLCDESRILVFICLNTTWFCCCIVAW